MAGYSFIVTVSAPNAPCAQTQTSVAVAHHGEIEARPRRACHQLATASTTMSTPTPVARYRCTISTHALPCVTGPVGIAVCADWISSCAPSGLALP